MTAKHIDPNIKVKIATNPQDLLDAFLVRAVSYADEGQVPLRAIVDGNDQQATHGIAYIDKEPIGSGRIRWFRDFAKFERLCFVSSQRNMRSLYTASYHMLDHIRKKGYEKVITYAEPKYAKLWQRLFGFRINTNKENIQLSFNQAPYIELVKRLDPHESAITTNSDPELLERIEGHWDEPVFYEQSA